LLGHFSIDSLVTIWLAAGNESQKNGCRRLILTFSLSLWSDFPLILALIKFLSSEFVYFVPLLVQSHNSAVEQMRSPPIYIFSYNAPPLNHP